MDLFPLAIFPEGSLRESVVTTVWVGVFVISFFNLRFGWTYSGLVVPGYLVPLLITEPLSGTLTIAEGMLAYALVRLFSEYLSRFGWWCGFFGRDRFFALLVSAVLVRVTVDGWWLPGLASVLQQHWNLTFDYRGSFHSFGLIIVALIANQFWKTGFWRGLTPFFTTLFITFFLVRCVLMTLTNFNVGHMTYMYTNAAASLLASPKSYIILIVTGFVASRMNLRYGWEYNGILIPALLALQWYEPLKIVSSLAEASVVFIVSDFLLGTSLFRGITMEGARKLLLFFNVAYLYRYCLGFILPLISPGIITNDYYGFAYLLSSLIALKMHSKHIVLRLTRATLQTSFFAAVAANLLGLWLASLLGSIAFGDRPISGAMAPLHRSAESLETFVGKEQLRLFRKYSAGTVTMPTPGELNQFREAVELLQKHAETGTRKTLDLARIYLHEVHYALELVGPSHLCLREQEPNRGWGFYVLDLRKPGGLVIEVPAPLEEPGTLESALQLYSRLDASTLAVAGSGRFVSKDGAADVLVNPNTPFEVFHTIFSRRNVLQVRGHTEDSARRLRAAATENSLYVKRELPRSLSLKVLETQVGQFQVSWKPAALPNAQQRKTKAGFAELWLTRPSTIRLKAELAKSMIGTRAPAVPETSLMSEWLLQQKQLLAKGGSNRFVPAAPEEMRFFDREILTPLLEAAHTGYEGSGLTELGRQIVQAINASAWLLGYEVCFHHDVSLDRDFLVLTESPASSPKRYWGIFVVRLGENRPYVLQVPRPLFDLNTLEFGAQMFERLQAESILIAGSHNEANQDQASDVLNFRNTANLFSLVNQVVMREANDRPKLVIQCRGYAPPPGLVEPPEILVAFQDGIRTDSLLSTLGSGLMDLLAKDGLRRQFVDGSPISAGYEISCVPQAQYVSESKNKEFAILWLSPTMRESFRPQDADFPIQVQLDALHIPMVLDDLRVRFQKLSPAWGKTRLPPGLKSTLEQYVATMDILCLQRAIQEWPDFQFSALLNRSSQQIFLLVSAGQGKIPTVLNLTPRLSPMPSEPAGSSERIELFLASRSRWLEWPL